MKYRLAIVIFLIAAACRGAAPYTRTYSVLDAGGGLQAGSVYQNQGSIGVPGVMTTAGTYASTPGIHGMEPADNSAPALALLLAVYPASSGSDGLDVTITRTGGTAATSVTLSTSDGSASMVPPFTAALAGTDYEALSTEVSFAEGETSKVVPITLLPRSGTLPNRRFTVTLSAPAGGATLGSLVSAEVRLLAPDSRPPTLAVRFPSATTTLITRVAPLVISGTAGDAYGLDRVEIDYGGDTFTATLGSASKPTLVPWSFELTPTGDGPVSLVIRAYDLSGNVTPLTRSFDFIRRYPVQVTRQVPVGLGTPDEAGAVRLISSKGDFSALLPKGAVTQTGAVVPLAQVTLTPRAMAGYAFSHWEGLPAGTSISGAMVHFQMPAEDVTGISAVFVTNPFLGLGVRPVFYGLIEPTESAGHSNATHGSLTAALVAGSGSLTGKIHLDGHTTAFTGLALGNGNVWFRAPDRTLHTSLDLPGDAVMTGRFESGQFLVEISDSSNTLEGLALAAAYSKTQLVPAALLNSADLGFYTAALPSKEQTPGMPLASYPQGAGYGSFTLKNNGTLRFAGVLADGCKFTAASALVTANLVPLHAQLLTPGTTTGEKGGSLLGHAQLDPDGEHTDVAGMDLRWFRPAVTEQSGSTVAALATQRYTAGWPEGITLDLIGAKYDKTATAQTTLGLAGPGQLTFNDGKLVAEVEITNFSVSGNSVIKTPSTDKSYTLSFTQSSGLFKGSFTPNWDSPASCPASRACCWARAPTGAVGVFS